MSVEEHLLRVEMREATALEKPVRLIHLSICSTRVTLELVDLGETPFFPCPEPVTEGSGRTAVPTAALVRGLRREGTMVAAVRKASPKLVGTLVYVIGGNV